MASRHLPHWRLAHNRGGQVQPNYRLRVVLALSLASLLGTVNLGSSARPGGSSTDAEALFAAKADPLLRTIRQAAMADRDSPGEDPSSAMNRERVSGKADSEIDFLSQMVGVNRELDRTVRASLTVSLADSNDAELEAAGFAVGACVGRIATVETSAERLIELAALASVRKMTAAIRFYPDNNLARQAIGIDDDSGQRRRSQTGRGVIVGTVDTGIDFRHLDFTVPGSNGQRTRIKALLDMTVYSPQAPPRPPDPNWNYVLPGETAPIGRLYTEADINAALRGIATVQQRDRVGHGTHIAGIAAGNGLASPGPGKYAGMAPEADLVIVKTSRQNDGTDNFLETDQINALRFIQQVATERSEPFVINMSLAGDIGPHDGTRANERAMDEIIRGGPLGRAVCVSGGSTGDRDAHASGSIPASGDLALRLNPTNFTQGIYLTIQNADSATVRVTRPDGVQVGPVAYNPNLVPGFRDQYIDVFNTLDDKRDSDPRNDQGAIIILFKPPAALLGSSSTRIWTFTLHSDLATNVHFEAWVEGRGGTFINFVDGMRRTTMPGTSRGAITVGSYVTRDGDRVIGDFTSFTSPGPTADGRLKPDISVPGFFLYSAKADGSIFANEPQPSDSGFYVAAAGNSQATPVATGAVALLLQANPNLSTDQIKSLIKSTATHDSFAAFPGWHERLGFGKLNVEAALELLVPRTGR